ncbi:hypothetical protein GOBAR_AA17890 [Gossypium barbadense]|uniref:Peptidyl-prolyl cis-trans isomerase n=1 Tax=Gossypium barbadense TaxID=3634 RepID=A0A2P5XHK1_GOSBA|nr:hypothetical protein GOBAR_AA17890 [Gossypium barbadense]
MFLNESPRLKHDGPGLLSMATADCDTVGSQFVITFKANHDLVRKYIVFGQLVQGNEILKKIKNMGDEEGIPNMTERALAVTENRPLPSLYSSADIRSLKMDGFKYAHKKTTRGYPSNSYTHQTTTWNRSNYANYTTPQYSNYTQDSSRAYVIENFSVASTSTQLPQMSHIPGVSGGYPTSNSQAPTTFAPP